MPIVLFGRWRAGSRWLNVFPIPTSMSPAPVPPTRSSMKESLSVLQRVVAYSRHFPGND